MCMEMSTMNIFVGMFQNPILVFENIRVNAGLIETSAIIAPTNHSDNVCFTVDEFIQRATGIALTRV